MNKQRSEILRNAAEKGDIWLLTYDGGPKWIRAGRVDLGDEADRGSQALYVDELRAMESEHLVEYAGGDYYRLTGAGFVAAKQTVNKIRLQEMATAALVEMVKQQAESWQQPDEVIWNELMERYCWPGCPKEDLSSITNLDLTLRSLNNGLTKLPPRTVQLRGVGIPPPPRYYQKRVSLSQVLHRSQMPAAGLPSNECAGTVTTPKLAQVISKEVSHKTENCGVRLSIKTNTEVEKPPTTLAEAWIRLIWKSPLRWPLLFMIGLVALIVAGFAILPEEAKVWILKHLGFHDLR